jgi:hypothetical protein
VSEQPAPIRSYQRIFRPERRLYSIEGRVLPVPGGVPLRWLAYAAASLVAVIALSAQAQTPILIAALGAGVVGFAAGGAAGGATAALGALGAAELAGVLLSLLDWPLRLVVIPAAFATLATQATPDGRSADRFVRSWLALRLVASRRSLGRPLPGFGTRVAGGWLWVNPDERSPELRAARLRGPARVRFGVAVELRRARLRRGLLVACRLGWRHRRGEIADRLELEAGERLEVRP